MHEATWTSLSICSLAAAIMRGWLCPALTTEMPEKQSRYCLPSTSVTVRPDADATTMGSSPCATTGRRYRADWDFVSMFGILLIRTWRAGRRKPPVDERCRLNRRLTVIGSPSHPTLLRRLGAEPAFGHDFLLRIERNRV